METDIKSLLDARAAALLRGVAKLPPIEQDLRRLRSTHAAPTHMLTCNPQCVNYRHIPQFGRSVITLQNRQPTTTFSIYPIPNRQQVHPAFNVNHHHHHNQWQQRQQPVRPSPPKKVCEEIHLPSPSVDTKTPLGVLISSARGRTRRLSDYSAVSPTTRELTLYSLVETLLKQRQEIEEEDESTPKQNSPCSLRATASIIGDRHRAAKRSTKPFLMVAHSTASINGALSPQDQQSCAETEHSAKQPISTSLCASRCSTADVGLSRASFWEDDDDEEYIDEQFNYVPQPPNHRKEASNRVYNLCEESL